MKECDGSLLLVFLLLLLLLLLFELVSFLLLFSFDSLAPVVFFVVLALPLFGMPDGFGVEGLGLIRLGWFDLHSSTEELALVEVVDGGFGVLDFIVLDEGEAPIFL